VRDAVLFSSYVPEYALHIGEYFIDVLRRHHAESKIFVGINHGSCESWRRLLADSGLDLESCPVSDGIRTPSDAAGYIAALDRFRRIDERFRLVWFGHTKGAGSREHANSLEYGKVRWTAERRFWARRSVIEEYFDDPRVGLYTPHNMVCGNLIDVHALQRIFPSDRQPLAQLAVTTYFVLRSQIVKAFCEAVTEDFFLLGVESCGGSIGFFEHGFPAVASLQGYEPYVEGGLGRTTLPLTASIDANVWADERQNHYLIRRELERWRSNPAGYIPGLATASMEAPDALDAVQTKSQGRRRRPG
jgi:hypothetical protein